MYPSDLTHYTTTHDLLLALLYSELGIYSVMHPASMYAGTVMAFEELKRELLNTTTDTVRSTILDTDVYRKDDMSLFYKLYKSINECNELMFSDEKVVQYGILPVIAEMIATYPPVAKIVERDYNAHATEHGDFVRARMERTLRELNVNSYIRLNTKVT